MRARNPFTYGSSSSVNREFVCTLGLQTDWKLVADFNFKLKNCSYDAQKASLAGDVLAMKIKMDAFARAHATKPFSLL